jgi:lipoprotein signal peptidase
LHEHRTSEVNRYWFPAKRYGWGWGLPATWQGWVVLIAFLVLVVIGVMIFPPKERTLSFIVYVCILNAFLLAICYVKGEPPAWHWGNKK